MNEAHNKTNNLQNQIATLPTQAGVYRYYDEKESLLYIGKAINLKKRISSYFTGKHQGTRIGHMVSQIARIETTIVSSETEALILESNLIKELNPRYNIIFRDDKTYPYLKLTGISRLIENKTGKPIPKDYPKLQYYRGKTDKENRYYGPYPNASAVKESIELLQKIFRLRNCEDGNFTNRTRPCLLHQINRCSAPCVGEINQENYAKDVENAQNFLEGKTQTILKNLQKQMQESAEKQEYENAAQARNQISALSAILEKQNISTNTDTDADVIAIKIQSGKTCINLATIRGGRHLGDKAHYPANNHAGKENIEKEECEILNTFIAQHYLTNHKTNQIPAQIITNHPITPALITALNQTSGRIIKNITNPKTNRRTWLEMAEKNAEQYLIGHLAQESTQKQRIKDLANLLQIPANTKEELEQIRIESLDISHTSGEATMASCVVFQNHQMQSKEYRRYNITDITAADDYAAMRQALEKRYSKHPLPTIVLVDGGAGQISSAKQVFQKLGLDITKLVGIEKGEGRKVGLEEFVFADGREKISPPPQSPALMLAAQIRDEAHRFAITGMRAKRAKTRTGTQASQLEQIEGIGAKRRAKLLARFGSIKTISTASIEEIASVEGISKELAKQIHDALN